MEAFLGMALLGTTMSAINQVQAGKAEKAAYDYNANLELLKAGEEEAESRSRTKAILGKKRSLYAKAGVDLTSGSPLSVLLETVEEGEEEAQRIRAGGRNRAVISRFYGEQAKKSGQIGGISSFLSGVGSTGASYMQYKRA